MSNFSRISNISKKSHAWSFSGLERDTLVEPYDEIQLKDCTSDQLQTKIEYLEKNVTLLESECDALEMYSVKLHPAFLRTIDIDVSWMPFGFKKKREGPKTVGQVVKAVQQKSLNSRGISDSIRKSAFLSTVQKATQVQKITTNHMIHLMEVIKRNMEIDFENHYQKTLKNYKHIEDEMEKIKISHKNLLQIKEQYRSKILVAALNPFTKQIPADKYEAFAKKRWISNYVTINEFRLKLNKMAKEKKDLQENLSVVQSTLSKITETDVMLARMKYKKIYEETLAKEEMVRKMGTEKSTVRQNYLREKNKMEKYESEYNLKSEKQKLEDLEEKILKTSSILEEVTTDDDDDDQCDSSCIMNQIEHYMEVKESIKNSDRQIKRLLKAIESKKRNK